ncbi:MAG: FAD-dependent oxidoreductase [Rhodobacteraceae bacterium]|nr:FAD-dependent oxidoreductase [Paracoccaceae bacterium]
MPIENMDQKLLADRFPGFSVPDNWEGIFEPRGGVLAAESCLSAYLRLARKSGAVIRHSCSLNEWRNHGGDLKIETAAGPVRADKLILTVGLWACELLADTGLPLTGRRITVAHFETRCPELYSADDLSVYFWATPEGVYAGFPHFDAEGTKIMRHDTGDVCTPKTVRRQVTEADLADVTGFADRYMPGVNGGMRDASACLYTMTPDSHFVVDRHPLEPKVVIATGFSGHGFKFAPVVGEAVADLAVVGSTKLPIGFLSADRFHQNLATDGRKTAAL